MKKQPAEANPARPITVLSVSPFADDSFSRQAIASGWEFYDAGSVAGALAVMRRREVGVVVCDAHLNSGTWVDVLEAVKRLPHSPPLIVASQLADERLWAEALNLGAFDVLAKPFASAELARTVNLAWLHWRCSRTLSAGTGKSMRTAC